MSLASELKRRVLAAVPPVLGLALVGFFAWHTLHGSRGLIALGAIQEQIALAESELARLEAERIRLERRVGALRAEHLDGDALDERARLMLNMVRPDDIVLPYGPNERLY
ncbi:septum formation initiator family protein [Elioraea sp. Yellowstone]|jgi:cell division protein FtsB|uniref:FtsB family cell division protein n=1 Tax=Elioraea sp. Yellowstone TaxID=2592070 RepID=UPI0011521A4D|nr:septum formation initiator family protein [Elioraea sp. Yellowstone]TQF84832.1 septum formation initiator family protein [Elioraea sp. Yellowstone]